MRTSLLAVCLPLFAFAFAACDDGDTQPVDASLADQGPMTGRDMRVDREPDVEVDMAPAEPDITLEPRTLVMLADPGASSEPVTLTIGNAGSAPLTVRRITLDAPDGPFAFVAGPPQDAAIAPGETLTVQVTYTPVDDMPASSGLTITSDDPDESPLTVPLSGRIRESCIRAMPTSLNLGEVEVGSQSVRFQVRVINCGDGAVGVGDIELTGDEGFDVSVDQGAANAPLASGSNLGLSVAYLNSVLGDGEVASAVLEIGTDLPSGPVRVNLTARGGGGPRCAVEMTPEMIDYETLRVGQTREIELTVRNTGNQDCELRSLTVEPTDGPEENGFPVVTGLDGEIIAAGSESVITVAYAPVVPNPLGDRAELRLSYHDPVLDQNRREITLLRGVGAEAQIGPNPATVEFGVTTVGCASWIRRGAAANVGFVPICVSGFRYEGEGCDRFAVLEEPDFADGCISLDRDDTVDFAWRHQPGAVGDESCTLIVESDAQNTEALSIPLAGTGTDTSAATQEYTVGDLDGRRAAYFALDRPADEDSIQLFVEDRETNNFGFSEERNAVVFRANNHPADEGEMIRIEYEAVCFDLVGAE